MIHTSAVIEGRQVTIGYREGKRETDLFTDMDFTLYRGELTTLLGTNGTGKSTLLRTMSPNPTSGATFYSTVGNYLPTTRGNWRATSV